jgi:hypothetical protein
MQCSYNSSFNKHRAMALTDPCAQKMHCLARQSKIDQDTRVSLPWPTRPLALASVRHLVLDREPKRRSVFRKAIEIALKIKFQIFKGFEACPSASEEFTFSVFELDND